ncbi:MAG: hypothetical protein KKF67_03415 [Nanoarchaeota archaeon]|nr:hypothetical protein [Nanoarchaeota archaeon]
MKAIIFDASTLISLAMSCLYDELRKLKQNFDGKFLITQEVKNEVIDKPLSIPRFQLEGIKIQQLLDEKVLELPDSVGVKDNEISKRTKEITDIANSTFIGEREIKLIDYGEASCLILSKILTEKKIENVVAVDERTMRSLCETPESLKRFLERKMHTKIHAKKENFTIFKSFRIIRSVELIYVAYKKGLIGGRNKKLFGSMIYALKFKGCSISRDDVDEMRRMG